jgi:hypothetical protein
MADEQHITLPEIKITGTGSYTPPPTHDDDESSDNKED